MKLYTMPEPKFKELSETETVDIFDYFIVAPEEWRQAGEYLAERTRLKGKKPILISKDEGYGAEAYRIEIAQDGIKIKTGGENGMRYAVYTLLQASYDGLPTGVIEDYPVMEMRAYQLNFRGALRHASIETICDYIKNCARAKLNTVLIEYDTRFDHGEYQPNNPFVLSKDEMNMLLETARLEGITVIPLIQTFGHLEFLLSQEKMKYLREEDHKPKQLCPLNPEALSFSKELIDMYVDAHPGIKYLHIGCDETSQLGKCPKCKEYVEKHGKGGLFAYFVNSLIDHVCKKGITPLIYDDMICANPEAMEELDRRAVLVYWDYWTGSDPTPLVVARGGWNEALVYDRSSWDKDAMEELSELQRKILSSCKPLDLEKDLKEGYLERYRDYLGDGFPKYFKAFPYIEYYKDQGFKVLTMPTSLGTGDSHLSAPDMNHFASNIHAFAKRTAQSGLQGMITSAWFPFPEAVYPFGIALAGMYSWGLPEENDK